MVGRTTSSHATRRILVKLSGEALLGNVEYGIDPAMLKRIATEIREVTQLSVQAGVVIGGGNIFRGAPAWRMRVWIESTARSHGHAGHGDERARHAG